MATNGSVVLSVVVMHHPRRSDHIPALLAACQPLPVRVVPDPDPEGPASPLRTAKRAWAAIAPGATHHVVLQDDILPMAGFAEHLHRAVAAQPDAGISLSVQQTSPRNSYAVRRAALAGRAFAQMSAVEWTPTLALALPAAHAAALASYLAEQPDEYVDDDRLVTAFCAERGIQVVAAVPNLIEHGDLTTLSLYSDEGRRPVTVYDEHWKIPAAWWAMAGATPVAAPELAEGGRCAVELRESRCGLRSLSTEGEPLEHPFTWDWRERADLVGARADQIVAGWQALSAGGTGPDLRGLRPALTLEVWAAGFLLGADLFRLAEVEAAGTKAAAGQQSAGAQAATPGNGSLEGEHTELVAPLRSRTVLTWLQVGLALGDRRTLTPDDWSALVDIALLAATAGARGDGRERSAEHGTVDPSGREELARQDDLDDVLHRMVTREAASQLLHPNYTRWLLAPPTRVAVRPLPCPWCGADAADPAALEPMNEVRMLRPDERPAPGTVTLHALACEWLTARAVLPLVRGVQDGRPDLPADVLTRAAASAEILARTPGLPLRDLLSEVNSWELSPPDVSLPAVPAPQQPDTAAPRRWVLSASPLLAPSAAPAGRSRDIAVPRVLAPHPIGTEPEGLDTAYQRLRTEAFGLPHTASIG